MYNRQTDDAPKMSLIAQALHRRRLGVVVAYATVFGAGFSVYVVGALGC